MNAAGILAVLVVSACGMQPVLAQQGTLDMEMDVSEGDKFMILGGFAACIVGVLLFLARDIILRRKTEYDMEEMESKRDKTFEKYHSDWGDEYEDIGKRSSTMQDREFREMAASGDIPDYYGILGVPRDAAREEIKASFRELVKKTHPDKTGAGSGDEMAEINKAYEVLSDEESRRRYDRHLGGG